MMWVLVVIAFAGGGPEMKQSVKPEMFKIGEFDTKEECQSMARWSANWTNLGSLERESHYSAATQAYCVPEKRTY